jgi:hypothetical protein
MVKAWASDYRVITSDAVVVCKTSDEVREVMRTQKLTWPVQCGSAMAIAEHLTSVYPLRLVIDPSVAKGFVLVDRDAGEIRISR